MKILLDTQALVLAGNDQLPGLAEAAFLKSENEIFFSLVSLWEIGIKAALGKMKFKQKISEYHLLLTHELGFNELKIEAIHIEKAVGLPFHHRDPFDRLIIGQALTEKLTVLSGDVSFDRYGCKRIWD